jgi:glycosyltransferase involved in cell wall biosynthesis
MNTNKKEFAEIRVVRGQKTGMNILFVVPYVPNLIRVRPYNLIRHLAARGHRVTVLTLWTNEQERAEVEALKQHCHDVKALYLPRWRSLLNCLLALPTSTPLQSVYCWESNLKYQIPNIKSQFDVVHVEHLRGARYGLEIKSAISNQKSRIPVVWDSVDSITHLFEQAAQQSQSRSSRLMTRLELGRTRRYEGWLVRQFDKVLVTSETDKVALERISNTQYQISNQPISQSAISNQQSATEVLPNGVDLEYFAPGNGTRQAGTVVFSGKMSYHANATAALYLADQVMPLVWAQRPDARLVIAGSRPTPAVCQLASNHGGRIEVTGYVPDLRTPLQRASVAVAPLLYGAGIQNKVLEAMACGTPVVASPLAVSALSYLQAGTDGLVADTPQAYAKYIVRLLSDDALRERIGAAGRRYVEAHHHWDAVAAQLETIYQRSMQDAQRTNG